MKSKNKLIFTVGIHGDEHSPILAAQNKLSPNQFIVCHLQALSKNVRFIETDLNRSFPGSKSGNLEHKIAFKLSKKFSNRQVIDLHTATCAAPPFIILTKITAKHLELSRKTGINKLVIMNRDFGAGKSLIDFVPVGISIESGREKSPKTQLIIEKIIDRSLSQKIISKNLLFFQIFKTLTKSNFGEFLIPNLRPFKLVTAGTQITNLGKVAETDFYPVLPRSKNYPNFLCLMAKKINPAYFNVKLSL